jgi:hypothetical protein
MALEGDCVGVKVTDGWGVSLNVSAADGWS